VVTLKWIKKYKKIKKMTNISQYDNFLNEAETIEKPPSGFWNKEKRLMKIFISPRLTDILNKIIKSSDGMSRVVANRIIGLSKTNEQFDRSYLDFVDHKPDYVSFMPSSRAWRSLNFLTQEEADKEPTPDCPMWKSTARQTQTIGKMINSLFDNFTDEAINRFSNAYKAEISALYIYDSFKIIIGEDIRKWYSEKNYAPVGGNLNQSCMRHDNCQSFFDIYCNNPEKCGLLILTDENNKLLGRALVWKNLRKPTDKTFMDRIYTVKQSDEELFKKYAIEKGWIYKYSQSPHDLTYVENGQRIQKSVAIQVKPEKYKKYPYMDTFKYYNPGTGRLGSDLGNPTDRGKRIKLEAADGAYQGVD
jgi:hypothetical protein